MVVRSKTPLRISFCGGGTDVSPYYEDHGGVVLSTTINKYAYVTLRTWEDNNVRIHSLDYDKIVHYKCDRELLCDGNLDLVKCALNRFGNRQGVDLFLT